jgi:hypothetical protein
MSHFHHHESSSSSLVIFIIISHLHHHQSFSELVVFITFIISHISNRHHFMWNLIPIHRYTSTSKNWAHGTTLHINIPNNFPSYLVSLQVTLNVHCKLGGRMTLLIAFDIGVLKTLLCETSPYHKSSR